jgi:hypothetical protein
LPNAEACLTWIDKYGDRDGDGFQEYQTWSKAGYENMAWKDSGDSVMYPDGTLVRGPKALCELQGYVYDAWLRMAELAPRHSRPQAPLGSDHSRHCGPFPGSPSRVQAQNQASQGRDLSTPASLRALSGRQNAG